MCMHGSHMEMGVRQARHTAAAGAMQTCDLPTYTEVAGEQHTVDVIVAALC